MPRDQLVRSCSNIALPTVPPLLPGNEKKEENSEWRVKSVDL